MNQTTLDQSKVRLLAEKMRTAAGDGTLEQKMSLLRMEAAELGIDDSQLQTMLDEARCRAAGDRDTRNFMQRYRTPILIVLAAFIVLELFLPVGWGWKILLILLTIVAACVLLAITIVQRRSK